MRSTAGARRRTAVLAASAIGAATFGSVLSAEAHRPAPTDANAVSAQTAAVVKTARNAKLGRTILVNRRGRSLYSLSAERRGRFICTDRSCLALWRPLVVRRGTKPTGVRSLGTIRRPDGKTQVTHRGRPLYTFTEDRKAGDIRGDGFRDVGVWHVVTARGG